jgi:CHAT domain-containing protein
LTRRFLEPRLSALDTASLLSIGFKGRDEGILHYAELEANNVANLMGGKVWAGPQPKKDQLRSIVADQQWLHFACHGWFNQNQPLESYLEMGIGEKLTAKEVIQDWRLSSFLVTLSACQTGLSKILRSDEPMGLVRAFLNAGAQAVLVSQWAVEDFPTFLLIDRFYRGLATHANADLGKLLHEAQRWLRNLTAAEARKLEESLATDIFPLQYSLEIYSPNTRPFAHPRYWAAFVLVGK